MSTIRGSCLCGGIKFEFTGPMSTSSNCHCSMCRKQHGAAFRSRARIEQKNFKWLQGEELVNFYESSPGVFRGFCRVCGSPAVNKYGAASALVKSTPKAAELYGIALATLDDDPGVRPSSHIFVASKAPWFSITDDLPQIPGAPSKKQ